MPNCFQLIRKSDGKAAILQQVDAEICAFFEKPCLEKYWYHGWYDSIGFGVACGSSFDKLKKDYARYCEESKGTAGETETIAYYKHMSEIVDWLDANFTTDAWYEVKR